MAKGYHGNRPGPYWKEALKGEAVPKRGARRADDEDEGQPQRGGGAKGGQGGAKGAKPSTHPLRKHAGQGGRPAADQPAGRPAGGGRGRPEAQPRGERAARGGGPVWGQREGGTATTEGRAARPERRAPRPRPGKPAPAGADAGGVAPPEVPAAPRLDGSGQPYITLVQWLKRNATAGTGAEGKHTVRAGGILVNGAEELRPGRKLHAGDTVTIAGKKQTVTL